jgi:putative nucleotidyltransferase with HDIG domain
VDYVERVLSKVKDLPAAPAVVGEVLRIAEDPKSGMHELSGAVERDPGLTAKLLRVSNSPYYGMRQNVGTLKLALVVLGLREVRNLILGISVVDAVRTDEADAALTRGFWVHAGRVAGLARQLGLQLRLGLQGESFVGGLLHDVGKAAMIRNFPDSYPALCVRYREDGAALCDAEHDAYGFTHAEIAAALMAQWGFPQGLVDAVRLHHGREENDLRSAAEPLLAAAVRLANRAAHANLRDPEEDLFALPGDVEAAEVLGQNPNFPPLLEVRAFLARLDEELDAGDSVPF